MDGLALVMVAAIMFFAGMLFGKNVLAKKAAAEAATTQLPDRKALAEAWQRGYDAGLQGGSKALGDREPQGAATGPPAVLPEPDRATRDSAAARPTGSVPPAQPRFQPASRVAALPLPPVDPIIPVDPRVRALRNINITLYVAALLMVAAASLFIALALPATAKVVGLGFVAAGFYVVGLFMHARSERLRPAAAAFTATGLALIPMTGLAHYLLLSTTPGASWFATSLVGTAAFVYAAGKLQSKIIAGLAATFLVSTAYSGGAVLNRGLIFYFLFSMLLATAITLVGFGKPRWISSIHLSAFTAAHRYLVPATLLAAAFSAAVLEARDYGWLFAAAALYYAVALVAAPATERFVHLAAARAAAMISIACFLHVAAMPATGIFRTMAALLLLQLVLLAQFAQPYRRKLRVQRRFVHAETWIVLAAAALAATLGAEGLLRDPFTAGARGLDLNWALALLLVAGVFLGSKLGGHFRWVPLGVALLGAMEPLDGNLGRQGLLGAAAAIGTWLLARKAAGQRQRNLRWAARVLSVPVAGALFSFAAAGWILHPRFSPLFPGAGTGNPEAQERVIEVAALVGLVLALLVQMVLATRYLRRPPHGTGPLPALRAGSTGEAVFFAGSVLCAAVATGLLAAMPGGGASGVSTDLATQHLGWGATLWLGPPWDMILLWLMFLAGIVGTTAVLGHRRADRALAGQRASIPDGTRMLVQLGGLLALGAALGIAAGKDPDWMVEVVALLGLVHVGIRIVAEGQLPVRVGYAVLAQLLFSGTAWHAADRFQMDNHGQFALFAFTIAAGQSARAFTGRNAEARKPGDPRTMMTLAAVGILVLLPLTYLAVHASRLDQAGLLVQLLCLAAFSALVAKTRARLDGGFAYVAIPAALGLLGMVLVPTLGEGLRAGGWLPTALWDKNTAFIVVALLLVSLLVAEFRSLGGEGFRWVRAALALVYWFALFGLHGAAEPGWQVAAGLLGAAGLVVFAATRGIPLLLLGSAALVLLASLRGIRYLHELAGQRGSEPLDTMLGFGATCVVLLIAAVFGGRFGPGEVPWSAVARRAAGWDLAHARVLFISSLAALGIGGMVGLAAWQERYVYVGAAMLLVSVFAAAAVEVQAQHRESGFEAAALVGAATIQRCWWVAADGMGAFTAIYYWVIVLGLLATYEFLRTRGRNGTVVLSASAVVLSLAGVGTFYSSTLAQQLLVLLTFTALLVFGLVANRKIFTVWGAVGVAIAVLWFLRGFTFLLLLLIAAGLIALALWRLGKMNKGGQDHGAQETGLWPGPPLPPVGEDFQHPPQDQTSPPEAPFGAPAPRPGDTGEDGSSPPPRQEPTLPEAPEVPSTPAGMPWMKPSPRDPAGGRR